MNQLISKIENISPQLDLGNLAVGIATVCLALVSVFISNRNLTHLGKHQISDFRKAWVENLRMKLAEFAQLCFEIQFLSAEKKTAIKNNKQDDADRIGAKLSDDISKIAYQSSILF